MLMTGTAMGQKLLTLEDVMWSGNNYYNLAPENKFTAWWGNTPLETTPDGVKNLVTGESLVTVERLNEIAGEKIVRSGHYITFPYGKQTIAQVQNGEKRIQIDWAAGEVVWSQPIPRGAANQDFNQTSKHLAYTIEGNLYVTTAEGKTLEVSKDGSTDGSADIVYGQSVHRDEFGITKGTFWSPDGQRLAFYRMDQSMVAGYPQVDISQRIASVTMDKYPMAGETSHQVKVGIFDVATQKVTWLQLAGAPDDYHTNLSWAPDGKRLYVFELNRDQNDMRLVAYDAETGAKCNQLLQERHEKYVEPLHGLEFLPWDASKAIMQSQSDGYNHLYLLDVTTGQCEQLTAGQWVVQDFLGFNTKSKSLLYLGNESDPRRSCIYCLNLKTRRTTLLGADDGVHAAKLSEDGTMLIDNYSSPTVPRSVNLISTQPTRGRRPNLVSNILTASDPWQDKGYKIPEITSGSIKAADGVTDLYYRMVKPVDFDPAKKYPTVVYVYGGPHAHNVDARWRWSMRGWEAYMATKGYLLFILDNRGSEWRGREFEQVTFRHLGEEEMKDQLEGVKFLKSLPYVDAGRMGVHGWSYGGFMTTNLMCSYPDVFKVGVAGGPVIDWKYYEVMYGERYMDTPEQNPEGYERCSLLGKAKNLKGRLQIIFGYNDPTCVPQHTLSFLRACEDAGTQPDLFTYPGDGHNMFGRDQIHLHERITRYFDDYLK
ncbi:MAG: DPP IV N-terminal domain-containing protein [Bacteroidaceae bacterium]|nr:DPP IV N-terminal domain-containing protein [Bacteroidaceae bacterium]MBR1788832.1 DPP IV N-terminal domain-containing protein [Bacteroidaceae bacterium]